jgi:AcrR family transcriptional regulator
MASSNATAKRHAPLTRDRVVAAAVALAQREGIEALTMRRLADELGAGAMSLYHYVPNKEELLAAMVDVVFAEIELPPADLDWREAMRVRARSTREALNRHRWAVGLMESARTPGPASIRLHDAVLGCLREAGFSVEQTVQAYSVLDAYLYGFALQEKSVPFEDAQDVTAVAKEQVDAYDAFADYPYLAEVVAGHVAEVGYDFASSFETGLDLILDALERLRTAG